eukprot:RCo014618
MVLIWERQRCSNARPVRIRRVQPSAPIASGRTSPDTGHLSVRTPCRRTRCPGAAAGADPEVVSQGEDFCNGTASSYPMAGRSRRVRSCAAKPSLRNCSRAVAELLAELDRESGQEPGNRTSMTLPLRRRRIVPLSGGAAKSMEWKLKNDAQRLRPPSANTEEARAVLTAPGGSPAKGPQTSPVLCGSHAAASRFRRRPPQEPDSCSSPQAAFRAGSPHPSPTCSAVYPYPHDPSTSPSRALRPASPRSSPRPSTIDASTTGPGQTFLSLETTLDIDIRRWLGPALPQADPLQAQETPSRPLTPTALGHDAYGRAMYSANPEDPTVPFPGRTLEEILPPGSPQVGEWRQLGLQGAKARRSWISSLSSSLFPMPQSQLTVSEGLAAMLERSAKTSHENSKAWSEIFELLLGETSSSSLGGHPADLSRASEPLLGGFAFRQRRPSEAGPSTGATSGRTEASLAHNLLRKLTEDEAERRSRRMLPASVGQGLVPEGAEAGWVERPVTVLSWNLHPVNREARSGAEELEADTFGDEGTKIIADASVVMKDTDRSSGVKKSSRRDSASDDTYSDSFSAYSNGSSFSSGSSYSSYSSSSSDDEVERKRPPASSKPASTKSSNEIESSVNMPAKPPASPPAKVEAKPAAPAPVKEAKHAAPSAAKVEAKPPAPSPAKAEAKPLAPSPVQVEAKLPV